jgi:phosphoserine phosphatase
MTDASWQPTTPFDAIIFDCDGTLSAVEGIDELAEKNGAGAEVKALTHIAMGETGLTHELYSQRLSLVKPTRAQVLTLGEEYYARRAQDIDETLHVLQQLKKNIYIVSAGIELAVKDFAKRLSLPAENIFSVPVQFDATGQYQDFDYSSPMIRNNGKREIVAQLKAGGRKIIYIGDGLNDLAVMDLVDRFVGYGGAYHHDKVAENSLFYIKMPSMLSLLPLALTTDEANLLNNTDRILYERGQIAIEGREVIIR